MIDLAYCCRGCNPVQIRVSDESARKFAEDWASSSGDTMLKVLGSDGAQLYLRKIEVAWFSLTTVTGEPTP